MTLDHADLARSYRDLIVSSARETSMSAQTQTKDHELADLAPTGLQEVIFNGSK